MSMIGTPLPDTRDDWLSLRESLKQYDIAIYTWLSGMSKEEGALCGALVTSHNGGQEICHQALVRAMRPMALTCVNTTPLTPFFSTSFSELWQMPRLYADTVGIGVTARKISCFPNLIGQMEAARLYSDCGGKNLLDKRVWALAGKPESFSAPGQSCSIEVAGWEQHLWYFPQVNKWLRNHGQNRYTAQQLDDMLFRAMAVKGWIAPDLITGDHWSKTVSRVATP